MADEPAENPFAADVPGRRVQPSTFVLFGATGDLAGKKLLPALYNLAAENRLPERFRILGVASGDRRDTFAAHVRDVVHRYSRSGVDDHVLDALLARVDYLDGDFGDSALFQRIAANLTEGDAHLGGPTRHLFYLAVAPRFFGPIAQSLAAVGLARGSEPPSVLMIEKPFGHDLASARELNEALHSRIREDQLFRIDHFLGKTPVADILYLRFGNQILEPVWNREHVAAIEITMAEDFGVADRGSFYDPVGTLRDVVQNHLLQVLALVAMEPPTGSDPDIINDRKADVFRAMPAAEPTHYVRGQYDGYLDVPGVAAGSQTETYCALRLEIDNWRWHGVPVFIRAGKALPERVTEVRLVFRRPPDIGLGGDGAHKPEANQLVLRIDPRPGASLRLQAKAALGPGMRAIHLDMDFADEGGDGPTPYEQLLTAAIRGDHSEFARQDSVEETWRIVQPLLDHPPQVIGYEQGSWGPPEAGALLRGVDDWHDPWMG